VTHEEEEKALARMREVQARRRVVKQEADDNMTAAQELELLDEELMDLESLFVPW